MKRPLSRMRRPLFKDEEISDRRSRGSEREPIQSTSTACTTHFINNLVTTCPSVVSGACALAVSHVLLRCSWYGVQCCCRADMEYTAFPSTIVMMVLGVLMHAEQKVKDKYKKVHEHHQQHLSRSGDVGTWMRMIIPCTESRLRSSSHCHCHRRRYLASISDHCLHVAARCAPQDRHGHAWLYTNLCIDT